MNIAISILILAGKAALSAPAAIDSEEFLGPFPSWRDLKSRYGAAGDGRADDTAPLQRALDDLTKHEGFCVLYIPAGTYRLTGTARTVRKAHTDCLGTAIIGESPETTVLLWDGPAGGTVLGWDAWYSRISRLTLDGAGKARTALSYGPAFSTYNETSDLVLRGVEVGVLFGSESSQGQAENEVLRCRFVGCSRAGILTANWNSMDIWVWGSRFEDCGHALYNRMGNFHAWENLFLRSRVADIGSENLMVFSFAGNTSFRSKRFIDFENGHTWGSPTSITGNRILEPAGDIPLVLGNGGPYLVMDNVLGAPTAGGPGDGKEHRAAKMTWGDQTFLGNTYAAPGRVLEKGRFRRIAEKVVPASEIPLALPDLPPTPPRRGRKVFEVPPGAGAGAIQEAIEEAAKRTGERPVVHLPMGLYRIDRTIVLPRGCDVQLTGDGAGETATRLEWTGPQGDVLLRLQGPCRATLRDFCIFAGGGRAILLEDADQHGGRIFADQLNVSGPSGEGARNAAALRLSSLDRTEVLLRCLQGSGNSGVWVQAIGGPGSLAGGSSSRIAILNGATGSAFGQYEVRDGARLVVRGVYHEKSADSLCGLRLASSGILAIDATRFSYKTSPQAPLVSIDGFRGLFTLATGLLLPVDSTSPCRIEIVGNGRAAEVLCLNDQFWAAEPGLTAAKVWSNRAEPPARGGLVGSNVNGNEKNAGPKGFASLEDIGAVGDAAILRHVAPFREARPWLPGEAPAGATDLRIHRIMASGGAGAAVEFSGSVWDSK